MQLPKRSLAPEHSPTKTAVTEGIRRTPQIVNYGHCVRPGVVKLWCSESQDRFAIENVQFGAGLPILERCVRNSLFERACVGCGLAEECLDVVSVAEIVTIEPSPEVVEVVIAIAVGGSKKFGYEGRYQLEVFGLRHD